MVIGCYCVQLLAQSLACLAVSARCIMALFASPLDGGMAAERRLRFKLSATPVNYVGHCWPTASQ